MQRYRVIILLVLFGVLPVVAAFFFALSFLGQEEAAEPEPVVAPSVVEAPPPPPPPTREVLATARALPVGTLIGPGDLIELMVDRSEVHADHVVVDRDTTPDTLRGYAVREPLAPGVPLTWPVVVAPGQSGFLAAVLEAGTRAVTIRVGSSTSQAALIDPGDRVDVILTAELEDDEGERDMLARTIVEDVRLVAVDRRIVAQPVGEQAGPDEDGESAERAELVTATLEVTPAQGDRLVLGEQRGSLSLAVRSLAGAGARTPDAVGERTPGAVAAGRASGPAVDLEDLLLSEYEEERASKLEERLMEEIAASEARLWAAIEERERPHTVRIIRGSQPPVAEVFVDGSPILLDLPQDPALDLPQDPGPAATPGRPPPPEPATGQ